MSFPQVDFNPTIPKEQNTIVSVTVGTVTPDDNLSNFIEQPSKLFTDYVIQSRYESDKHIYMGGITSPGGFNKASVSFVQLASPTLLWIVDWTASRFGSVPLMPDPGVVPAGWILMDEHYEPAMLGLCPDGVTPLYRISGTFVYGTNNPNILTRYDLLFPIAPWMKNTFTRTVSSADFFNGLIS